jgi:alanyl-tRNA synthetase
METYHNPFLHRLETKVKNIEEKDDFLLVELENTIFYPGGGGQPNDKGIIKNENFHGEVVEISKKDGKIIHKIKLIKGKLSNGDSVICEHDIERRLNLLRMHSGEHIFMGALLKIIKDIKVNKINLREDESSLFVECDNLTWEQIFKAERIANQIIKEGRDIIVRDVSKEEAAKIPGLRIKLDRIKDEKIRIVEIKDHDISACAGVHALKTDFIGNFLVTKFNLVHGSYEIRFKTNISEEFFDYANIARKTASIIKKDVKQIPEFVENFIKDNEEKTAKLRELSAKIADDFKQEKVNDINFIHNIFEDIEKKQLTEKANSLKKEKTVVCFLNKIKDNAQVIITCSEDSGFKANELLKIILEKFNGKGGGRNKFAMGAIKPEFCDKAIETIKESLK